MLPARGRRWHVPWPSAPGARAPLLDRHLARLVRQARRRPWPEPVVPAAVERDRGAVEGTARAARRAARRARRARIGRRGAASEPCATRRRARSPGYFAITSVSKCPAATATTATPAAAHRAASSAVSASTVARAAPECAIPGMPWCGESVTLIDPPAAGRLEGQPKAASDMFSIPSTFSRQTARQPFGAISSAGLKNCPPALLTSTSSRPWRSSALADRGARAPPGSRTSPATQPSARPTARARRRSRAAACSSTSARRPAIVTLAPQRASSNARLRARDRCPPPVTSTAVPASALREDLRPAAVAHGQRS